jgi:hypothetical protein
MKTMTVLFTEEDHISNAIITAETKEECVEKYFLKYPDRRLYIGTDQLVVMDGAVEMTFGLGPRDGD